MPRTGGRDREMSETVSGKLNKGDGRMPTFKEIPFCTSWSQGLSPAGATKVKRTNFR